MKRIWGSVCTATILLAGAALLFPACNHPDASIFIQGVAYPPTPTTDGTCTYTTASATQTILSGGTLDVAKAGAYSAFVLVGNQILPQNDPTTDKAETSRVNLQKVTVHVTDAVGKTLGDYTTQVDGFVDVGSGGTPGFGDVATDILAGPAYDFLAQEARADRSTSFRAVSSFYYTGTTLGDVTVVSDTFSFNIDVCYGCLVNFAGFTTADRLGVQLRVDDGSPGAVLSRTGSVLRLHVVLRPRLPETFHRLNGRRWALTVASGGECACFAGRRFATRADGSSVWACADGR